MRVETFCVTVWISADISGDTNVNVTDLLAPLAAWGAYP